MSEHAPAYSTESLTHRFLVLYEAAGLRNDFASYLVRSLLSEGKIRYETVEKTPHGMKPRLIEREGPTGLIVTTTAVRLHPENETRLLSVTVNDSPQQTQEVLVALAEQTEETSSPDREMGVWHRLQEWLAGAEHHVVIPYARLLAKSIKPVAVRLRRDFGAILSLIRAHAILHQTTRERDPQGRIVAALSDYAAVRDLVGDLIAEGVELTVSHRIQETVDAVRELSGSDGETVSVSQVAKQLKLDKASASRRVKVALEKGYLKNLEERRGRPFQLVPGDALPEEGYLLPLPETLSQKVPAAAEPIEEMIL